MAEHAAQTVQHGAKPAEDDETLGGFIVPDPPSDEEDSIMGEPVPEDGPELEQLVISEASAIAKNMNSTTVNGRTLRDRKTIAAPKDAYWERFGKRASEKLAVTEHKREMLDDIKAWRKEFSSTPEGKGYAWPTLHLKSSTDDIEKAHAAVIEHFELDLADDDEDSEDEEDDDDMSDDDTSDNSEESDDDEEDDEDDDDEEDDDE
jgi:hypothetical protein